MVSRQSGLKAPCGLVFTMNPYVAQGKNTMNTLTAAPKRHWLPSIIAACLALLCCLSLASCHKSGGSSRPEPPELSSSAPTPNFLGTWGVVVEFTGGTGPLATLNGTKLSGKLIITKSGSRYILTDGQITRTLYVRGNTATFSYSASGVSQTWSFTVFGDDVKNPRNAPRHLAGIVKASSRGYTANAKIRGSLTVPPSPSSLTLPSPQARLEVWQLFSLTYDDAQHDAGVFHIETRHRSFAEEKPDGLAQGLVGLLSQ